MLFELQVAIRFLKEGKSQTLFILAGIAIGVSVQVFLSSLITGLQKDLVNNTVGNSSHITAKAGNNRPESSITLSYVEVISSFSDSKPKEKLITNWNNMYNKLSATDGIVATVPFADGSGFIRKGNKDFPVVIRGTDIDKSNKIYKLSEKITKGEYKLQAGELLIGNSLASELDVSPGNSIRLTTSDGVTDIFRVKGIFDLENESINSSWLWMDLSRAQKLLGTNDSLTSIEMQIEEVFDSNKIKGEIKDTYPEVNFETWQENNASLLTALNSQSSSSWLIQFFVILAVALGISSVLAVSVMQKSKQIGILKAMGAKNSTIGKIFLLQGGILGILGALLGAFLGIALIQMFLFFTSGSGSTFPIEISPVAFMISVSIATLVGIFAAFFPAKTSTKLSPIEVIRNG